jgi:hypothetical protein
MIEDLGNLGQALAALVAVVGIPLAVRQLRMQNRMSRVEVTRELEKKWVSRTDWAGGLHSVKDPILSKESAELVSTLFARTGVQPALQTSDAGFSFPRTLMVLAPTMDTVIRSPGRLTVPAAGPRNEAEYQEILVRRCQFMFPTLDELSASENQCHRSDIQTVIQLTYRLAASMSDVAEMFDFRLADPEQFLEKRHLAVIRDLHAIEPFLLWQAIRVGDHRSVRGLRALALGASARSYAFRTDLHGIASIDIRYDLLNHLEKASYGPLLQCGTMYGRLPAHLRRVCIKYVVAKPFRDRTKRAQHRLIDRVNDVVAPPISGSSWSSTCR